MKQLLTDIFAAVYIVNLPERVDRRLEMELELKTVNLSYQNKQVVVFPAIKPDDKAGFPSIGARGCFLSHLSILRQARDNKANSVLFMEDDLAISPKLQSFIPSLATALEAKDWSILYLGHVENIAPDSAFELLPYSKPVMTTHFYAVNGNAIDRLITFLETVLTRPGGHPDGGPMHYDGALSTFRKQNPDIITLLASPNLGWQRSSRSDVAETKWFDEIPVIRSLAAQARKARNWIKR
jgi:glycosyl transferase, family 25